MYLFLLPQSSSSPLGGEDKVENPARGGGEGEIE
jgi:hypothetical protein